MKLMNQQKIQLIYNEPVQLLGIIEEEERTENEKINAKLKKKKENPEEEKLEEEKLEEEKPEEEV